MYKRQNESNSVISDRTFLVKSIKIIKANAVLDGRSEANLEDLKALKYILAFRVPEEVLKMAEEKLESLHAQKKTTKKYRITKKEKVMTLRKIHLTSKQVIQLKKNPNCPKMN